VDEFAADFERPTGSDWTVDELLGQETDARFARVDLETAIELGRLILERGERQRLPIAFEIYVRDRLVFRAALAGSNAENDRYLASKLKLARETGHPTLLTSRQYRDRLAIQRCVTSVAPHTARMVAASRCGRRMAPWQATRPCRA
jgi:uncharacterized protein (UPF0303 family)